MVSDLSWHLVSQSDLTNADPKPENNSLAVFFFSKVINNMDLKLRKQLFYNATKGS